MPEEKTERTSFGVSMSATTRAKLEAVIAEHAAMTGTAASLSWIVELACTRLIEELEAERGAEYDITRRERAQSSPLAEVLARPKRRRGKRTK